MKALFIILTGLLILVNAFFVIAEYSLVRSRRARLQAMVDEGKRGARMALVQLEEIGDYIAACQVGITMASIGIGALGEPAIAHVLEPLLGNAVGHTAAVAVSVVIAYLLITIAQSIIGEIAPSSTRSSTPRTWPAGSRGRCASSGCSSTPSSSF